LEERTDFVGVALQGIRGIAYVPSERVKSDIYRDMLPILNSRQCQLLDIKRLTSQLHGLERRTARGGRDSIDHGPGQHDDVANAVAGSLVLLALDDRRALIRRSDILVNGAALPIPAISRIVFATLFRNPCCCMRKRLAFRRRLFLLTLKPRIFCYLQPISRRLVM
jgi:hypothetical protein